jgi:hypothetical protein
MALRTLVGDLRLHLLEAGVLAADALAGGEADAAVARLIGG